MEISKIQIKIPRLSLLVRTCVRAPEWSGHMGLFPDHFSRHHRRLSLTYIFHFVVGKKGLAVVRIFFGSRPIKMNAMLELYGAKGRDWNSNHGGEWRYSFPTLLLTFCQLLVRRCSTICSLKLGQNDEDAPNSSFQKIAGREKYLAFIASKFKNNFLCHDKAVHPKRFVLNETCLFVTIEVWRVTRVN